MLGTTQSTTGFASKYFERHITDDHKEAKHKREQSLETASMYTPTCLQADNPARSSV